MFTRNSSAHFRSSLCSQLLDHWHWRNWEYRKMHHL